MWKRCYDNEECGCVWDVEEAGQCWRKSAALGYGPSMAVLATRGEGVWMCVWGVGECNLESMLKESTGQWAEKALQHGHPFGLAWMSEKGPLAAQDRERAIELYKEVNDIITPWAHERLGAVFHLRGDYDGALFWYHQAANAQQLPNALYAIGDFMANGRGCVRDIDGGLAFMLRAADQGHYVAQHHLSALLLLRGANNADVVLEATRWAIAYARHSGKVAQVFQSRIQGLCEDRRRRTLDEGIAVARELGVWGRFLIENPSVQCDHAELPRSMWPSARHHAQLAAIVFLGIARKRGLRVSKDMATLIARQIYETRISRTFSWLLDSGMQERFLLVVKSE